MKGLLKKVRENKKGFTLAELLVVVAIVGILVAISIPVFTAQLSKARKATNQANIRAAKAAAVAQYMTDAADSTGELLYDYDIEKGSAEKSSTTPAVAAEDANAVTVDSASSQEKYNKFTVKIKPNTTGSGSTETLNGAEVTVYAKYVK